MPSNPSYLAAALLALALAALYLSLDFSGAFALNDDWGYSTPVRWWVAEGRIQLTHWQSMPLLPQFAGAALWSLIFGFGQESLRGFTASLAGLAVLGTFGLARSLGIPTGRALILAGLLIASPIFLTLSLTFMSDICFAALAILATWALAASLQADAPRSRRLFWLGAALVLLAMTQRQTGLGLSLGYLLALAVHPERSLRKTLPALLLVGLSAAIAFSAPRLFAALDMLPRVYFVQTGLMIDYLTDLARLRPGTVLPPLRATLHLLAYTGLFLLPALPLLIGLMRFRLTGHALLLAGAALLTGLAYWQNQLLLDLPATNVLSWQGVGPREVAGTEPRQIPLSLAVTLIALWTCLGTGALAVTRLTRARSPRNAALALVLLSGLISYGPHMAAYFVLFDRYTIVPGLFLSLALFALLPPAQSPRAATGLALAGTGLAIALSATLVSDNFTWQRARADLAARATDALNLPPEALAAGFAADNLAHVLAHPEAAHLLLLDEKPDRSHVIAKSPLPGHEIVLTREVPQRLGPTQRLYVLKLPEKD